MYLKCIIAYEWEEKGIATGIALLPAPNTPFSSLPVGKYMYMYNYKKHRGGCLRMLKQPSMALKQFISPLNMYLPFCDFIVHFYAYIVHFCGYGSASRKQNCRIQPKVDNEEQV